MNLDNLKRLASEKGREWWLVNSKSIHAHTSEEGALNHTIRLFKKHTPIHVTEASHAEKLAQALSKMIEVVEIYENAFESITGVESFKTRTEDDEQEWWLNSQQVQAFVDEACDAAAEKMKEI